MSKFTSKALACLFVFAAAVSVRPAFADDPKNAFQATLQFNLPANYSEVCPTVANIPANKRLVIEYASATVGPVPSGTQVRFVQLRTFIGKKEAYHNVSQDFVGPFELVFGQMVKLYSDYSATMCVARAGQIVDTVLPVSATISGYLVDMP
jgi:hypothetical protein